MDNIHILFFLFNGFLLSRFILKNKIGLKLFYCFTYKKNITLSKIILILLLFTVVLSCFISNVITVLILLPVIQWLSKYAETSSFDKNSFTTMLALSVAYGANIGGMSSVLATPANVFLIAFLEIKDIPIPYYFSFTGWLLWGIPLVIIATATTFILLSTIWQLSKKSILIKLDTSLISNQTFSWTKVDFIALLLFMSYLILSLTLSTYIYFTGSSLTKISLVAIISLVYIIILFIFPFKIDDQKTILLSLRDCFQGIPTKSIWFLVIFSIIALVFSIFNIQEYIKYISIDLGILYQETNFFFFIWFLAFVTSMLTEIISNTVVQISFFLLLSSSLLLMGNMALLTISLLTVTLSCTCAFMGPLATGVNGLAFGIIKKLPVKKLLVTGFSMSLVMSLLITVYLYYTVLPLFATGL